MSAYWETRKSRCKRDLRVYLSKYRPSIGFEYVDTWVDRCARVAWTRCHICVCSLWNDTWAKRTRVRAVLTGLPYFKITREREKENDRSTRKVGTRLMLSRKGFRLRACLYFAWAKFTDTSPPGGEILKVKRFTKPNDFNCLITIRHLLVRFLRISYVRVSSYHYSLLYHRA